MSLDPFVGHWEIRWQGQGDPRKYKPGTILLIGRHGTQACSVAWLDGDGNLCSFSEVGYDEEHHRLHGRCTGQAGREEKADYDVDISFLLDSKTAIAGDVAAAARPGNDDPLTGSWTADRRPGRGDGREEGPPAGGREDPGRE